MTFKLVKFSIREKCNKYTRVIEVLEKMLHELVKAVSNPQHLLAMWGRNPGSQDLFSLKCVGHAADFEADLFLAQRALKGDPLPTVELAALVMAEPWHDGLVFLPERPLFVRLLRSACDGHAENTLRLSLLTASYTFRRQQLLRFYKTSTPGIDALGLRSLRNKTVEFQALMRHHLASGPTTEIFGDVLGKVSMLKDLEAMHKLHAKPYSTAERLLSQIKSGTLQTYVCRIAELAVAAGVQLEDEFYRKSAGPLLELRWSFRFLVMTRCADLCSPLEVERWMYIAEACLPKRHSTTALDELRVYAKV